MSKELAGLDADGRALGRLDPGSGSYGRGCQQEEMRIEQDERSTLT